jgi:uncharacterized protein (TIGR03083 family)
MPISLGDAYRGSFRRIDAQMRSLAAADPASLGALVPACPGWTVHSVVSHLAGIAVDALAGRLTGPPDDEWTAGQVDQRLGVPVEEVLDEWGASVERVAAGLDDRSLGVPPCADVLVHEGDLVEALGVPVPPVDGWGPAAGLLCRGTVRGLKQSGTLTVRCGGQEWAGGAGGDPVATVEVEPWEFFRGVFSRRSVTQMRGWAWDGDPDPWLAGLVAFGLRDDDPPRPVG